MRSTLHPHDRLSALSRLRGVTPGVIAIQLARPMEHLDDGLLLFGVEAEPLDSSHDGPHFGLARARWGKLLVLGYAIAIRILGCCLNHALLKFDHTVELLRHLDLRA